jgi:hypothetical protein
MRWGVWTLLLAAGLHVAPAFAAKDTLYASSASWTVNASAAASTPNLVVGANGHTTLNVDVNPGDAIVVSATWSVEDNSASPGTDSTYPRTITFATVTNAPPSPATVTVGAIPNCALTARASTCSTSVSFTAPATLGTYQLQVNTGSDGGANSLNTRWLQINFTVVELEVVALDTKLTVDPQCFLLHDGDVDLTATLEELISGDKIAGADIDFELDSVAIGTEVTDSNGVATLTHNIDSLAVGDYSLYAEFDGDTTYNPSNDSDTLGISYLFVGFGQPINGDGTSIFGGRVIPVKIKLTDAHGVPVTDATPQVELYIYDEVLGLGTELEKPVSVSAADTGNTMRYAPEEQQYIFNWDAKSLPNGTYAVVVDLGDSPSCRAENPYAIITVAKKVK